MAAAAIGGAVGGLASTGLSFLAAAQQRKFIKKMYQHRYQYQMEDMRKAGLNPILSYSQSPPGGPQGGMAQITDMAGAAARGASAYESTKRGGRVSPEEELLRQQTATSRMLEKSHYASAEQSHAGAQVRYREAQHLSARLPQAKHKRDLYESPAGKFLVYGREGGSALGAAAGGFTGALRGIRGMSLTGRSY